MRPSIITKEELSQKLIELHEIHGMMNESIINEHTDFSRRVIRTHFGCMSKACEELGLTQKTKVAPSRKGMTRKLWTKEEVVGVIYQCVEKHGYFSKGLIDLNGAEYGLINHKVIVRIWGSFAAMFEELEVPQKPSIKDTHIISTDSYREKISNYIHDNQITFINSVIFSEICKNLKISEATFTERIGKIVDIAQWLNLPYNPIWQTEEIWIQKIANVLGSDKICRQWTHNKILSPKGRKLKCDAYFPEYNLALEYNGELHYEYSSYFHKTKERFAYRCECDQLKYKQLNDLGIKLLIIKFDDNEDEVMKRLQCLINS